jgi:septum formation protein
MGKIVLASASPRRKELLENIGLKFDVVPSNYAEDLKIDKGYRDVAMSISREKALVVAAKYDDAIVIAADTFGVFKDKIIGKPSSEEEARVMVTALSGKMHLVITGFTIIDTGGNREVSKSVETKVYIKKLTVDEIRHYVYSREPLGKAGAYAIQGLGSVIVERIEGDYYNVMGLPLCALVESLKEFGIYIL